MWGKPLLWLAAGLLALVSAPVAAATEAQVKAAYLFKLASLVRWPQPPPGDTFRICAAGRPDIANALAQLVRNQEIGGKRVELVQLGARNARQASACQIMYLGGGGETAGSLMEATGRSAVLTVTDRDNGTRGGAVEFVIVDGKVRFAVNRRQAETRQLELSAKLMDVAVEVRP